MQVLREDKLNFLPLVLAVVVAALLVVVLIRGISFVDEPATTSPRESRSIMRTEALLAGIPQHGIALGSPEAPVTLQFFGDLQCKMSRQVMLGALPFLIRRWVRDGELRILFRALKTDTPDSSEFLNQQIAALAAGRQNKMWTFVNLFYREQRAEFTRYADDAFLEGIAEQAGLSLLLWTEDRKSDRWVKRIESDELMAGTKETRSTPSFLIGPTDGKGHRLRHFSLEEPVVFDEAIRGLL